ncbi:pentapeptide repeat-containing protein [Geitlerinema sp. PCC 9228]|uniref:pentapeptide repeat-containing protein n=1 Tax=Geitlerinema sp. PCC 9228 TaxID=111611 RepID=UPI0008F98A81|nr:pentapeptide repeat-containing protein [Geitlerinema sp. PCC 9228]
MGFWRRIWEIANTEIQIPWEETAKGSAETGKAVLDLAEKLQKNQDIQALQPYISKIDSLLDALNSPLANVVGATFPFLPLATGVLQLIAKQTRQEPSLQDEVLLVSQTAYLQSMQQFFQDHPEIQQQLQEQPASEATQQKIKQLGTHLVNANGDEIPFEERDAEQTLLCFHESKLAQVYNPILQQRLQESGLDPEQANMITERISRSTHRYMKKAVAKLQNETGRLSQIYGDEWLRDLEIYNSIDSYLEEVVQKLPKEPVFDENFSLQDIYVSLQVQPVKEGKDDNNGEPEYIEEWAERILTNPEKKGQVLFVQAGPGRGKSVFCKMFAERVREKFDPIWIPIFISLRDIETFQDFQKTLTQAVSWKFADNDGRWLKEKNTRFLFLLDGFDELVLERGDKTDLREFLEQVSLFQQRCARNPEQGHKILITGRPLALLGIERKMPDNLERVEINLMTEEIQEKWLENWQQVVDTSSHIASETTQKLRDFLQDERCPESVQKLAQEPLLLYLLAAMHRDDSFSRNDFDSEDSDRVKVQIYQKAFDWVLHRQRTTKLIKKITDLDIEDLKNILEETGLCVVQSGAERAQIQTIEDRFVNRGEETIKEHIERAKQSSEGNPLRNALATFYIKSSDGVENSVEFLHKSFGEFLCAARLEKALKSWAQKNVVDNRKAYFSIKEAEFNWQVYDLLGFGFLTPEIIEFLRGLLKQSDLDWQVLFERLYKFYWQWGDGKFIESFDASEPMLPLKKARQMQKYRIQKGQRQVDISAGLNVLILLSEIHRYAQSQDTLKAKIVFHPCGNPEDDRNFDENRLLRIIGYSECLGVGTFPAKLGAFLRHTALSKINLSGVVLFSSADLKTADLKQANLSGANLSGAILNRTDLSGADLSKANLKSAFIQEAKLTKVENKEGKSRETHLSLADLSGAVLHKTDLSYAKLNSTVLKDTDLSNTTFSNAELKGAFLQNADLRYSNLTKADLTGANLQKANLEDANLSGAMLKDAVISNAYFNRANLHHANLQDADLEKAELSGADLSGSNLSNADLRKVVWNHETKWSNVRGVHQAVNIPQELKEEPSFAAAVSLNEGIDRANKGEINAALKAYQQAEAIDTNLEISASFWSSLCWLGSINDCAADVLSAGDKAVEREPENGRWRDTRGLARALTGDVAGAIEDFQSVLENHTFSHDPEKQQKRQRWLQALQAGENPFTPEELDKLRPEDPFG